jgi:guanylate kinase
MKKIKHPLIIIVGPSGSGKDTLLNLIKEDSEFSFPPSLTTRNKREGEKQGIYNFITKQEFEELIKNDAFIEYDFHFDNYFGTSKKLVLDSLKDNITIKQIDINGVKKIIENSELKYNTNEKTITLNSEVIVNIYFVGILMESVEKTKQAIIARGNNKDETQKRIGRMQEEYTFVKSNSDFIVINPWNNPEKAAVELKNLIKKLGQ